MSEVCRRHLFDNFCYFSRCIRSITVYLEMNFQMADRKYLCRNNSDLISAFYSVFRDVFLKILKKNLRIQRSKAELIGKNA